MTVVATTLFRWHDGGLDLTLSGWLVLVLLMLVMFAFADGSDT